MYGHPFKPYEVQNQFMNDLYEALSTKKIGLFESPTGTGKTLSLLCPSVSWLRDSAKRNLDLDLERIEAAGGPQWLKDNAKQMRVSDFESERLAHKDLMEKAQRSAELLRQRPQIPESKRRRNAPAASSDPDLINQFLLEDRSNTDVNAALDLFSEMSTETDTDSDLAPLKTPLKIFFASRTHSQLAQVADALASIKTDNPVRFVPLGSRRQLCIHPDVTNLSNVNQMNEKCAELQKHSKCSFRNRASIVRNQALGEIMDIEDLARFGKEKSGCPYYAARETVPYAEVVALPYPMLLTERNREALAIDLRESVVIIDEAHNLIDTVTSLHSVSLSAGAVNRALTGLQTYNSRVGSRLSPTNRRRVHQVIRLVESLAAYFKSLGPIKPGTSVDISKLFAIGNVDTLDLNELSEFVQTSKLVFKVDSYLQSLDRSIAQQQQQQQQQQKPQPRQQQQQQQPKQQQYSSSALGTVMDFVLTANDPMSEGKLFHDIDSTENGTTVYLRYLVLDASYAFKDIVDNARTVILAGGTMEPVSEFTDYLVPSVEDSHISKNSYGHIVPKSQLLVMPLSQLRFTFATRADPKVVSELGNLFLKIVSKVPNGVVAFFPGYNYLSHVVKVWKETGVFARLEAHKRVFTETSGNAETFSRYSGHATGPKGALLLAVVGGRLSEGINFSDALARAVIMVGLPFPNAFSAEMVAKRAYIEQQAVQVRHKSKIEATEEARQYYENLAMRAVNQSVGRAIRHIKDYAAIYLIDERYKGYKIQTKLSKWVRDGLDDTEMLESKTEDFFKRNNRGKEAQSSGK